MSALLQIAKSEITRDGYVSEKLRKKIFNLFCFWDPLFALACLYAGPPEAKGGDQLPEKVVDQQTDELRAVVIPLIDERLEKMKIFEKDATQRENLAVDAEARSLSLPSEGATDKLLRYEAHLDRQLDRAMNQLERVQRRRCGENVPPPLNISLRRMI